MGLQPATPQAYRLLQEGALAFARMEEAGIRIDMPYLDNAIVEVKRTIAEKEQGLRESEEWQTWARHYGNNMSLNSPEQMGNIMFNILGHKRNPFMKDKETKKDRNNEAAFEHLQSPFCRNLFEVKKLGKALSTNLYGIRREVVDGFLHPFFDAHTVESYRSSSSRPNFHNQPTRLKMIAKIVRACVIPRDGHELLEADYGTQEVRVSYCYHGDEKLKYDALHGDMHRDRAKDLFLLSDEEMGPNGREPGKTIRYTSKNRFVFAQFYGSYFGLCAPELWDAITLFDLRTTAGVSLHEHLASKGIKRLGRCDPECPPEDGTFEQHVANVEKIMWKDTYTVYDQWKRDWWEQYQRDGGVNTLTGFRQEGVFKRNQILCDSIQGCLQGHVRVWTYNGLDEKQVPIKELVGKTTQVWTGFKWAKAVGRAMGKCQLARVTLSSGIVLDCDTRHKFKNELNQWIDFKDLKIGGYVALPILNEPGMKATLNCQHQWPFTWGFILGDGSLMERKITDGFTRRFLTICGGKIKKPALENISNLLGDYFNTTWREIQATETRQKKYILTVEDKKFTKLTQEVGFNFAWKAHTKQIPAIAWEWELFHRRNFMEGLWLSDGSRGEYQEKNLHMCNLPLLLEVQEMIAPMGFDSTICQTKDGWLLRVHRNDDTQRPHRKYPREAVLAVTQKVRQADYLNLSEYSTDASAFYRKGGSLSQRVGQRIIEKTNPSAETYRFDTVTKIEMLESFEETYTMSVDDPLHQYVAGGVICKNSAFHCLLWSIPRIQWEMIRRKMRSKLICQIHDSMLFDAHKSERGDIIEIVNRIALHDVARHWLWIKIPLAIEWEKCPLNWFQKTPLEQAA